MKNLNKMKIQMCDTSYAFFFKGVVEEKSTAMATLINAPAARCKHAFSFKGVVEEKR